MKCRDARKITYISEYPEVVSQDLLDTKKHAKECRECREFFNGERLFSSMLRDSVIKDTIPKELRDRVLNLKTEQKRYSKTYQILAIAASILIFAVGVYIFQDYKKGTSIAKQIVEDHIKFLPMPEAQISSSSTDEIKAWFRGKVDFSVNVPDISAKLKGGRLCLLDKKRLALLFYEHNGSLLSLFISDGINIQKIENGKEVLLGGKEMLFIEERGYNLLLWQDRGLTYALVSELSFEEIKRLI